ncbi:restriction endonuclease subunit S [Marinimicrobium sp. ABcell2]|uniref:restriction endonuclease subunit S n=1 Tax=Marinimicrobium sp. ABcell2 TaxID=3069751 RepID=UPI0027AFB697|nr:restriction endonuclease subunit S [Marinimicrobium sp. ABcell2]MDQ2076871.1 restriction endonuclease subunit S [Marinimicrobium sp. ABcell2]
MSDYRKLGDVSFAVKDKINGIKDANLKYIGLEHLDSSSSYLNGYAEPSVSISTNSVFKSGDTIFGKLRPNLRKSVLAPFDGYCSTDLLVLRSADDVVPEYAARVFQSESVFRCAEETAVGTKMPRTSWAQLRQLKVFCPEQAEQKTIANILDTLDTQIRQTEAIIAKLQQVKQGLLHDLLTRGIDANGQLRPPRDQAPELYKESPLGWIPREWELHELQSLSSKIVDGTHFTPTYTDSGVPFLRVTNVQSRTIDPTKTKYISKAEHSFLTARCAPQKGDILLSKNGTVGIAKLVDWDWEFSIFVSLAMIRLVDPEKTNPSYVTSVLNSNVLKLQIQNRSKQGTVINLHLEEIREFLMPVPGRDEQDQITAAIRKFEQKLFSEEKTLGKLKKQKSGLMDDLLTGRVRVNSGAC